jgi:RNA polymerase sigma-70 factor (ECF subfamily)
LSKAGGPEEDTRGAAATLAGHVVAVGRRRDRAAFAALFAHFAPRVKTYLLRLGMPEATAEELAQETMLVVWRKAVLFDPGRAAASTWVFAVARNLRADALRRERPRTALEGEAGGELPPGAGAAAAVPDAAPDAEKMLAAARREARLRDALRALPEEQARVLELSYFGDLSHAEIGRRLGVPLGTVKGRLRLALARLRIALEGDEP